MGMDLLDWLLLTPAAEDRPDEAFPAGEVVTGECLAAPPDPRSDTAFLERVLREGPTTTNEILRRSFTERGCGLTVHSRAADLRRQLTAETVTCMRQPGFNEYGKADYVYALVPREAS